MSGAASTLVRRGPAHGLVAAAERAGVNLLVVIGAGLIGIPLALTLYLSLFDEKLVVFPPRGYTLNWYPAIIPNFGGPLLVSFELAVIAVAGSLLLGVPSGIALSRHRSHLTGAIAALLLAPITFPGIALSLAIYVFLILIERYSGIAFVGFLGLVVGHLLV
ncbi:MAG: ABC transporter permease, partial [Acetobacteraceae bacterium]